MVKRHVNMPDSEPEAKKFDLPSQREHLLQVIEVYTPDDNPFTNGLPKDIVSAKCEVVGGEEEGRSLLQRMTLDDNGKGFWATRLFLKAIGEPHKGNDIEIDTDRWIGRQFFATVIHNGNYANIDQYNFEKSLKLDQVRLEPTPKTKSEDVAWDE